jgi:hypothetical protein
MSEPIVFISRNTVNEGKLEVLTRYYRELVSELWNDLPGTLTHLAYANEDGSEVTIVHIFPDAPAMERHMQGAGPRAQGWYEFADSAQLEVFGAPTERTLEAMKRAARPGVTLIVWPNLLGGWIRLKPG